MRGARLLTIATLALAAVAVGLFMFGSFGGDYTVSLKLDNASQLVTGNRVKVGGVPVGSVKSIELDTDRRALVEISVTDGVTAVLHDAGHILGSAIVELRVADGGETRTIVFSGALGRDGSPILRDPTPISHAEYVVVELTKPLASTRFGVENRSPPR